MGDSDLGSAVGFGAVAVLAILAYKKVSGVFSGSSGSSSSSTPADNASKIVEVAGGTKETIKEVIIQSTGSGTESGKFDPWSIEGILGSDWLNKFNGVIKKDKTSVPKTPEGVKVVTPVPAKVETKSTDVLQYLKSGGVLTNVSTGSTITAKSTGSNKTVSLEDAASRSWGSEVARASGQTNTAPTTSSKSNTSKYTSVASSGGSSSSKTYSEGGQTKYKGTDGKVHIIAKNKKK